MTSPFAMTFVRLKSSLNSDAFRHFNLLWETIFEASIFLAQAFLYDSLYGDFADLDLNLTIIEWWWKILTFFSDAVSGFFMFPIFAHSLFRDIIYAYVAFFFPSKNNTDKQYYLTALKTETKLLEKSFE